MEVFQAQTCGSRRNAGKERFDKFACLLFDACVNQRFLDGLRTKNCRLYDVDSIVTAVILNDIFFIFENKI